MLTEKCSAKFWKIVYAQIFHKPFSKIARLSHSAHTPSTLISLAQQNPPSLVDLTQQVPPRQSCMEPPHISPMNPSPTQIVDKPRARARITNEA
jgi:hypothetical protein